jgi:hypothetical protein
MNDIRLTRLLHGITHTNGAHETTNIVTPHRDPWAHMKQQKTRTQHKEGSTRKKGEFLKHTYFNE